MTEQPKHPCKFSALKSEVLEYYDSALEHYGPQPAGVDWNSIESQELRFIQLLRLLPEKQEEFTLLDYGCGYGALFGFMRENYPNCRYTGFDISERMIQAAQRVNPDPRAEWTTIIPTDAHFDFVVASGLFNVRLGRSPSEWDDYIVTTLDEFHRLSVCGFAFNVLTSYNDPEYRKEYLHYADPRAVLDHCMRNYSRHVSILHDYKLYEFTTIVRK